MTASATTSTRRWPPASGSRRARCSASPAPASAATRPSPATSAKPWTPAERRATCVWPTTSWRRARPRAARAAAAQRRPNHAPHAAAATTPPPATRWTIKRPSSSPACASCAGRWPTPGACPPTSCSATPPCKRWPCAARAPRISCWASAAWGRRSSNNTAPTSWPRSPLRPTVLDSPAMEAADLSLFAHVVNRATSRDLAQAALMVAEAEYPGLDIARYIDMLDTVATRVREAIAAAPQTPHMATVLHVLYEDLGFRGNAADYYDPKNSFLKDVLDNRRGIPITLAIVLVEICRRVGVDAQGVSFPGHFLVRRDRK